VCVPSSHLSDLFSACASKRGRETRVKQKPSPSLPSSLSHFSYSLPSFLPPTLCASPNFPVVCCPLIRTDRPVSHSHFYNIYLYWLPWIEAHTHTCARSSSSRSTNFSRHVCSSENRRQQESSLSLDPSAFLNLTTCASTSETLELVSLRSLVYPRVVRPAFSIQLQKHVTIGPTSHLSPSSRHHTASPYHRSSKVQRGAANMTNTNSRMENGANLSQSMDSVNNVNVGGEEEVRAAEFYFSSDRPLVREQA